MTRELLSAVTGEILGSIVLIGLGLGISMNLSLKKSWNVGNTAAISGPLAWGFAVAMAVIVSMPFDSGGHFSPAVTLGLALGGKFPWDYVLPYIGAQCVGCFLGAILPWLAYKDQLDATADQPEIVRMTFCTNAAVRNPFRNFLSEVIATFFLLLVILMMLPSPIEVKGQLVPFGLGSIGAIPVGFLIFAIGMAYGGVTGWSLNPTRDLMPRLAYRILPIKGKISADWGYGIRNGAIAPLVGASLAALVYYLVKGNAMFIDYVY